ncbi:MAG: NAD(P)H-dependent oxidoreductase subunit E [Nitrospirae bacterium]|nr:NAD(P)H-dependent oxidoreductase subunit E [Nitrospirota bacterium]MCL5062269.1 NAD(P)H-dependent oxidoreductase subunit E [Nitrospirota bacterium]MDA8339832.1 NAD(P)H-dependent oxidoreductase subunit E [Nitrospiraceae bacterium]
MEETLKSLANNFKEKEGNIISLLQETQDAFGYIPEEAVYWFSKELDIPASNFFGVATFYAQFYLKPRGKNIITACCGTACHVKGSDRIINNLKRELNLADEQNTTEDKKFTLEQVACVGACSIAPVVIINKRVYGKMSTDKMARELKVLKEGSDE